MSELSPEQKLIVSEAEARFVVTAAAGAGKTRVLVERYLRHVIDEGLRPDQILTITFTRKAAAEMKTRIVDRLRESGHFVNAQIAETGPIQTIHSFCERLLRENALEAGLDPSFEIMSESQSSQIGLECIRMVLSSDLTDSPEAEALIAFLAGKRQSPREGRSPYAALENSIHEVLQEFRASGHEYEALKTRHRDRETLRLAWESQLKASLDDEVRSAMQFASGTSLQERVQATCKELRKRQPRWASGKPEPEAEAEALTHSVGLVHLACEAWARLKVEMNRKQSLDFTELESRAVRLLSVSEPTRQRVREQYQVVMVDEAQDLNPVQYRLLGALGPQREMMVGDPQQSIYGFRQTDEELFKEKLASSPRRQLKKNWRSEPGILTFVDLLFGRIWNEYNPMRHSELLDLEETEDINCAGVEFWHQPASDTAALAKTIDELIRDGIRESEITVLVRNASLAIDLKDRLGKLEVEARIAGGTERFYTRLEVRDLANVLRAVADPYDDFSLLACLRSPIVDLSLDSIVLLGNEPLVIERLSSFKPPIGEDAPKLMAFLSWYLPLKGIGDRLSAWEVLADVFARSEYLTRLARRPDGKQQIANVRKLLALATQEPELGPLEYAERIREIQDVRHREGDAPAGNEDDNVVTLMTIHKAKGLEFDTVIVPQTDRALEPKTRDLVVDARLGLVATKFGKVRSMVHRYLSDAKALRDEEEELRVLYVAMTRAKKRLCVCLYPAGAKKTLSKVITSALGKVPPQGVVVREASRDLLPSG